MLRRPHRRYSIGVLYTDEMILEAGRLVAVHSVADGAEAGAARVTVESAR